MQSACKKVETNEDELAYISREDFTKALDGEWYVLSFTSCYAPDYRSDFQFFWYVEDTITYTDYNADFTTTTTYYSKNDSVLCTLPFIENMQNWTILILDGPYNIELFLETQDLCGVSNNFKIDFTNYRHEVIYEPWLSEYARTNDFLADVKLIGQDTITLTNFRFDNSKGTTGDEMPDMTFCIKKGGIKNEFELRRP